MYRETVLLSEKLCYKEGAIRKSKNNAAFRPFLAIEGVRDMVDKLPIEAIKASH